MTDDPHEPRANAWRDEATRMAADLRAAARMGGVMLSPASAAHIAELLVEANPPDMEAARA